MTSRELLKILKSKGCAFQRSGKGSHQFWVCGECRTVISVHPGKIPEGTWRKIKKQLEPCLGKDWWK